MTKARASCSGTTTSRNPRLSAHAHGVDDLRRSGSRRATRASRLRATTYGVFTGPYSSGSQHTRGQFIKLWKTQPTRTAVPVRLPDENKQNTVSRNRGARPCEALNRSSGSRRRTASARSSLADDAVDAAPPAPGGGAGARPRCLRSSRELVAGRARSTRRSRARARPRGHADPRRRSRRADPPRGLGCSSAKGGARAAGAPAGEAESASISDVRRVAADIARWI